MGFEKSFSKSEMGDRRWHVAQKNGHAQGVSCFYAKTLSPGPRVKRQHYRD